jgi:hypothetical protein
VVTLDVKDDQSAIQRVGIFGRRRNLECGVPVDGIADSRSEHYEIAIEGRVAARGITIRAIDSMNNVSTTQVESPAAR